MSRRAWASLEQLSPGSSGQGDQLPLRAGDQAPSHRPTQHSQAVAPTLFLIIARGSQVSVRPPQAEVTGASVRGISLVASKDGAHLPAVWERSCHV